MLGASWELFMCHGGDKGGTGSPHRACTALLGWLRLWLWCLVNINCIACAAWRGTELCCSFCCTDTRDRAALAGWDSRGECGGQEHGMRDTQPEGQAGAQPLCPELCYLLLSPSLRSLSPFLGWLSPAAPRHSKVLDSGAKPDLPTSFLGDSSLITKPCRYLQYRDIWQILLVPVIS